VVTVIAFNAPTPGRTVAVSQVTPAAPVTSAPPEPPTVDDVLAA